MGKPKMIGFNKLYVANSRMDTRYRRKMETSRPVIDRNRKGGMQNAAKQSKA